MDIKGVLFDINGTMIDIHTDEHDDNIYRTISNLLSFQGIQISHDAVREKYFHIMKEQRDSSGERYPEFDVVAIFKHIVEHHSTAFTRRLNPEKIAQLPLLLAEVYRAASRHRLHVYHGVRETIEHVTRHYRTAIVSDAQSAWALPELNAVGLLAYFDPIIISGDYGYRKPDKRLFETALEKMKIEPQHCVFVGNDIYHDVHGARQLGMKTVLFKSNQGAWDRDGIEADYIIYKFPELLDAIHFIRHHH